MSFTVYIVICNDGSFYTGYAADVEKRIAVHNLGTKGAKYTKSRRPVRLVYSDVFSSKSEAMKREVVLKRLTRKEKEELVMKGSEKKV